MINYSLRRSFGILLILLLQVQQSQQTSSSSPCPIDCVNGVCVQGEASFLDHPAGEDGPLAIHEQTNINGFHCGCDHGFTGVVCDVIFESCSDTHKCYNQGRCISGLTDKFGNDQQFCDCSNATDQEGYSYVGKYCEHKAVNYCQVGGNGGGEYDGHCVFGECNPNYPQEGKICNCANSFGGPHCEYKKGTVPDCDLNCQNGGHCVLGEISANTSDVYHYWDTSENQQDMQHCVCQESWDGDLCQHRKSGCGDGHCFNGARCVEKIGTDQASHFHCDCTAGNSDNGDNTFFAGKFCQYRSTSICGDGTQHESGNLFCVNGGTCRENSYEGCDCQEGYTGFSCEFRTPQSTTLGSSSSTTSLSSSSSEGVQQTNVDNSVVDDPTYYSCDDSICQNGGKCRKGAKDLGMLEDMAPDVASLNQTYDENFEHCVCTPSWSGLYCQVEVDICGEGEHLCAHGSKCVSDGKSHACDCSQIDSEVFAGKSCEHQATQICTEGGDLGPGKPLSFCTNGGTCRSMVSAESPHAGCDCHSDWEGPHCEMRVPAENEPDTQTIVTATENDGNNRESESAGENGVKIVLEVFLIALCLVLFVAVILAGLSLFLQHLKKRAAQAETVQFINDNDGPGSVRHQSNISPHRDSATDPFPNRRFHSSSSDPFASMSVAASEPTRQASRISSRSLQPVELC